METTSIKRFRIRFFGTVQGVGFRYSANMLAVERGLTGWVRNEHDGTVLMEVQGQEARIYSLLTGLGKGTFIRITAMEKQELPLVEGERTFKMKN